jgi:metallo-beta-lactamase family protein
MMDSAKIQAHDAAFLRKQAKKQGDSFDWQPLFN